MVLFRFIERLVASRQIAREIRHLGHADRAVREQARARLRMAGPACRPALRRIAFRQRSLLALDAAAMLCDMGDTQGIYAVLSQYSDRIMFNLYGSSLRDALRRIGPARIVEVLENCLDRIETHPLPRGHWSLSLAVYALNGLRALQHSLPEACWKRALVASSPGYEDLRLCRIVVPQYETSLAPDDWRIGSTLAAVRRSAIDALLQVNRQRAYPLLRDALASPDIQVQLTSIYGLRCLRDPRAYILLQRIAVDRRHPLSRDARRAIEAFGSYQPEALTLLRASNSQDAHPDDLLRPAVSSSDADPNSLLRPRAARETQTDADRIASEQPAWSNEGATLED